MILDDEIAALSPEARRRVAGWLVQLTPGTENERYLAAAAAAASYTGGTTLSPADAYGAGYVQGAVAYVEMLAVRLLNPTADPDDAAEEKALAELREDLA